MADTTAAEGLTAQQWDAKFYLEYINESRFKSYSGLGSNNIIHVKEDLIKKKGDSLTYALVNRLTNDAVTGSATLEGNEEDLSTRSFKVTVDQRRHAVRVPMLEEQFSAISLRDAGREALMDWVQENTRDEIIKAMGSINGVPYATASEAQKDAWLVDNADRVLFGAAKSNNAANDHSAGLAAIDNTADQLKYSPLMLMKRMALTANPKIRPIRLTKDKRYYVLFAGSLTFRDLQNDPVVQGFHKDAMVRGEKNILFTGGDIMLEGVIVHEIPEIPVYAGVGAGGINVSPVYLCGQQAIAHAIAKRVFTKTEDFDYGDKHGVAMGTVDKFAKMTFGSGSTDTADLKDHGILTGYFASVGDA